MTNERYMTQKELLRYGIQGSIWAYFAYWASEPRKSYTILNPWSTGKDAEF